MVSLQVVMRNKSFTAFRNASSPKKIIRSRQLSLIVRTNRSAYAFKFGDRGGNFTFNPAVLQYWRRDFLDWERNASLEIILPEMKDYEDRYK